MGRIRKKNPFPLQFSPKEGLTGQLPLFMTPRQISDTFQPLDADRHEMDDPNSGDETLSSRSTNGWRNMYLRHSGSQPVYQNNPKTHPETDEVLWDRKYYESTLTPTELNALRGWEDDGLKAKYRTAGGRITESPGEWQKRDSKASTDDDNETFVSHTAIVDPNVSLHSVIHKQKGNIPGTISLSTSQFGEQLKPEILGGHHRLSVLREDFPDAEVPVQFFDYLGHAKSTRGYT